MNFTCVICSDLFIPSDDIHITSCGHIFHYGCLLQWLEHSKSCPQCRNICNEKNLIKAYMNVTENVDNPEDQASLLQKLNHLTLSVREKNEKIKKLEETSSSRAAELSKIKKMNTRMGEKIKDRNITITMYKYQLEQLQNAHNYIHDMVKEMKQLKEKCRGMSTLERIIDSTSEEVDEILALNDDPRSLAFSNAKLKRELQASECKMNKMRDQIKSIQEDLSNERAKQTSFEDQLKSAESEIYILTQEVKELKINTEASKSTEFGSDTSIPNTPDQQAKRNRSDIDLNGRTPEVDSVRGASQTNSDLSDKYSNFRQSRPADSLRLCGAKRKDNQQLVPSIRLATNRKTKQINPHSISARLKSGKLREPSKPAKWMKRPSEDYNAYYPTAEDFQ